MVAPYHKSACRNKALGLECSRPEVWSPGKALVITGSCRNNNLLMLLAIVAVAVALLFFPEDLAKGSLEKKAVACLHYAHACLHAYLARFRTPPWCPSKTTQSELPIQAKRRHLRPESGKGLALRSRWAFRASWKFTEP